MRCPVHLSIGQEAAAVGICEPLNNLDLMVSTHRGHAHMMAKGGSLKSLIAELYGKITGCGRGQAGSMHLIDVACGFMGSTSIVAGTVPVGVGMAKAKQRKKQEGITVICIGDAVVEEGVFHESANLASINNLPVVFVLENNFYSCFTHIDERQPVQRSFEDIAKAHGLLFRAVDGNNVDYVSHAMADLKEMGKPSLLVLETYRHLEHCGPNNDDHLNYRDKEEIAIWKTHDPILKISAPEHWIKEIKEEIAEAFKFAEESPFPGISELGAHTYAHPNNDRSFQTRT